jgi:ABC-type Zn uptake system ZnuABC Zn-binding protein ZnuA
MKPAAAAKRWAWVGCTVLLFATLGACAAAAPEPEQRPGAAEVQGIDVTALKAVTLAPGEKLRVVATTNIVGDVVANVGGDRIDLTVLMGVGVDPHTYLPTPSATVAVYEAHLVLANGAGLEANLEAMLHNAGGDALEIHLADGVPLRPLAERPQESAPGEAGHGHGEGDPHVWFSVPNVICWVETIEQALSALDPAHAEVCGQNAHAYREELKALDDWIQEQVALIPEANRKLVTNHPAFGYLADRYGLEQVGTVYPVSPAAEPSARDLAALQDTIRAYGLPAVFTESTVNPSLARQVTRDTGVQLVPLYSGSLGGPGSGAETYLEMMRYNVQAIVAALR